MIDQLSILVIQILLGIIVLIAGWGAFMVKGWASDLKIEQRDQWKYINQNRSDISRLKGVTGADD